MSPGTVEKPIRPWTGGPYTDLHLREEAASYHPLYSRRLHPDRPTTHPNSLLFVFVGCLVSVLVSVLASVLVSVLGSVLGSVFASVYFFGCVNNFASLKTAYLTKVCGFNGYEN